MVYGAIETAKGAPISFYVDDTNAWSKTNITAAERTDRSKLLQNLTSRDDLIQLKFPITHNNESLGNFLVGISRVSLESEFQRQLFIQLLVLTAIVLFLSLAIHIVFRINVLFPIRRLIAASEDVSRGRYTLVNAKSQDELGVLARAFNTMTDAIKREQAALHRQANFDALTGLPNRMMAFDRIKVEITRAKRSNQRFAVFFLDLDNFKTVNDSMGHAVGDEVLIAIGGRVQLCIRESDIVARLGGDEFVVLAPDITNEIKAEELAGHG